MRNRWGRAAIIPQDGCSLRSGTMSVLLSPHPCTCHMSDSEQASHMCFVEGMNELQARAQRKPGLGEGKTGVAASVSGDGQ